MTLSKTIAAAALTATSLLATSAFALDLNGTRWKTIDDKSGKPKAVVEFKKQADGSYSGSIVDILDPAEKNGCTACAGTYKGKKLTGVTIVNGLKDAGTNAYEGGKILDPKNGKTYSFKAKTSADGKTLNGRGYIGVSLAGRSQTWYRVN